MAITKQTIDSFMKQIAPCAQHAYKTIGKVLPSVCIGMACVESAYGTAGSAKWNSFLGQKVGTGRTAKKYWNGKFFKSKTKEEYTIGTHTVITDAFRAYDSMQQCVLNYYELLNTSLYKRVKAGVDFRTQMKQIKQCGYMTSSTEVNSVCTIIAKYNLTRYDAPDVAQEPQEEPKNGNPYPIPTGLIKMGTRGNSARWLQVALNSWSLDHNPPYCLKVDGIIGEKSITALKDFQTRNSLTVDSIAGPATISALVNASMLRQ